MSVAHLLYLLPLVAGAILGAGLALYAWNRRPAAGSLPMAFLAVGAAVWGAGYGLELASPALAAKVAWARIEYLGIVTVPVAWFALALEYRGRGHWLTRRNLALLSLLPLITLLTLAVAPSLIWSRMGLTPAGPFTVFAPNHGPWFWVHTAYSYLLLIAGSLLLVDRAVRSPTLYRWQTTAFLASVLLPWLTNFWYITGFSPLDLTPFGLALSATILASAIFRVHLFDVIPVARATLFDSMTDPVIVLDGSRRIVDANPAVQALTGQPAAALIGRPAEALPAPIQALISSSNGARGWCDELTLGQGAEQHVYQVRRSPVHDRQRLCGQVFLFHDIGELKRAEAALRREKLFSESIISSLPGIFYLMTEEGELLRWNDNLEEITGYQGEELHRMNALAIAANGDHEQARQHVRNAFNEGRGTAEITLVSRDGRQIPYLLTGRRVLFGDRLLLTGMGLDISERRQRERELQSFVSTSRALRRANSFPQMLPIILDEALNLLQAGGALLALLPQGAQPAMAAGRGGWARLDGHPLASAPVVRQLVPGEPMLCDDARRASWPEAERLAPNYALAGTLLMHRDQVAGALWVGREQPFSDGEARSLMAIAEIAANALDRARALQTVEHRVRQRTRELNTANERLRALDHLKSKLIDDLSHELRTPVTTILLYLDLLAQGGDDERERYLVTLREQGVRLNRIIESVLYFSSLEATASAEAFDRLNLNDLLQQVIRGYRPEASAAGLPLWVQLDPDLPPVRGNGELLAHAVAHLLDNAIKYSRHGTILVTSEYDEEQQMIVLGVADCGIGISPDDLPHVFERFYRGRQVSQRTTPGSGLGLSLTRQIILRHGGTVEIESQVEQGTTARIYLPAQSELDSEEQPFPRQAQAARVHPTSS